MLCKYVIDVPRRGRLLTHGVLQRRFKQVRSLGRVVAIGRVKSPSQTTRAAFITNPLVTERAGHEPIRLGQKSCVVTTAVPRLGFRDANRKLDIKKSRTYG